MNYSELGIRTDNVKESLVPYSILATLLCCGVIVALQIFNRPLVSLYNILYPLFWFSIPLSILQEVVFRGYGIYKLKTLFKNPAAVIGINTFLFSLFHLLIPETQIVVPLSFLAGLAFATVYYYYPNLFLVSIVHVLVNLIVLPVCYLSVVSC